MTTRTTDWEWMDTSKIPAASCAARPEIEQYLDGKRPCLTSESGASQEAATAIAFRVEAFRVTHTQKKSTFRGGVERQKQRETTIGWVIRTTRRSRWEGEGVSVEHEFLLGENPGKLTTFDCRFSDPIETEQAGDSLELWRIQNTLTAEWANR